MRRFSSQKGSASALIILVLTVLVLLGVLSLVTVAADRRLAGKRAEWLQAYYQLDTEAVRTEALLDNAISEKTRTEGYTKANDELAMLARQILEQANVQEIDVQSNADEGILDISYIVGNSDSEHSVQLLEVKLAVSFSSEGKPLISKMKWQQRQSERPQSDETGVIWIPE